MKKVSPQQFRTQIGPRIRSIREERGMKQCDLAEALGMTPDYISRVEKGAIGVSIDTLLQLRELFQVDMEYLMCGVDLSDTSRIPPALLELWNSGDVRIQALLMDSASSLNRFVDAWSETENP